MKYSKFRTNLQTLLQVTYAVILSPALVTSMRLSPSLHRILSKPLVSGPFEGKLNARILSNLYQLEARKLTDKDFIQIIAEEMVKAVQRGELNSFMHLVDEQSTNLDITLKRCLGYLPLKWWYLKLHYMTPENRHQLHAHRNVISAQVIIRGSLAAEQYNLVGTLSDSPTQLEPVSVPAASKPQMLLSTNTYCNVHGFQPTSEGALRFQFYLRGHTGFLNRFPKRGRLYVHLRNDRTPDGYVLADIGEAGRPGES